jgi:benzoate/toluate 1,2-dioxygenase beta subunit
VTGRSVPQVEAEAFLVREARLLDEGRFDEWLALFTDDGWYWVPSQPDQADPFNTVSLIYDDRRLLETRVRRLSNPHLHAQQPRSSTSRIVANVTIESDLVRSKLLVIEYRQGAQRTFAGTCRHKLVLVSERLRIAWKRVDLVNCDDAIDGLVIPL